MQGLPPHLNYVAALPGEIQKFQIMAELLLIPSKLLSFTGNWTKTWQYLDDKCYKNIMMILLHLYVQHDRMQITQERSEYDLMINSVKFIQQTSSPRSEGDSSGL